MTVNLAAIRMAREHVLGDMMPVTNLVIQAYSNLTAASSGTRPCTSCCTQCWQNCCLATYS